MAQTHRAVYEWVLHTLHTRDGAHLRAAIGAGPFVSPQGHPDFSATSAPLRTAAELHNTNLATADKSSTALKAEERKLGKLSSRMLTGVRQKFGEDSDEYEQAGGIRESERKAHVRGGMAAKSKEALGGA